jgi:hypothetical protein
VRTPVNIFVDDALGRVFTTRVNSNELYLYKRSIAITEICRETGMFDGIIYPTLAMRANTDNLALLPEVEDTKLELVRTEFYHVEEVDEVNFLYKMKLVDTATSLSATGEIAWKGRGDRWPSAYQPTLSIEDGLVVARDASGNLIDPE